MCLPCVFHQRISFLGSIIIKRGLEMNPTMVKAAVGWPAPQSHKALQRIFGFAHFYRFVCNYSSIAAPLTLLTPPSLRFLWTDHADQFIVEVDASDVGIERSCLRDLLRTIKSPCAFYSHWLTQSKCHYDVGDQERLTVKNALQEWRHWLKRAKLPFLI